MEYLDLLLNNEVKEFVKLGNNYLDNVNTQHNIKFSLFVILLLLMFIIIWVNMLNSLNTEISRAKGVFNILPTYVLNSSNLIKDINTNIFT